MVHFLPGATLCGQRGFTLFELVTAATVASLLALAGGPLLAQLQDDSGTTRLRWQSALQQARVTAIASGAPVIVCASNDGTRCDSEDWRTGWLVYQTATDSADRQVLESYLPEDKSGELQVFDERLRKADRIEFNGLGFSAGDTRTISTVCNEQEASPVAVVIERSGRIHSSTHWTRLQLQTSMQPVDNDSLQQVSDQELYETICRS